MNLQGRDPLTLLSGGLGKYDGITSSLRNLEARFPLHDNSWLFPATVKVFLSLPDRVE